MKNQLITLFFLVLVSPVTAQGDLLVNPVRVVFEGNKTREEISLTNIGKDTAFYSISFIQYDMLESGGFKQISDSTKDRLFASDVVRVFPRKVILPPNVSQSIRLQLRKTSDMAIGEYRSHLYFRSDKSDKALGDKSNGKSEGIGVQLRAIYGLSIPVIVRNGILTDNCSLQNLSVEKTKENKIKLTGFLCRTGTRSVYGDLVVQYIYPNGRSEVVGRVGGIGIYTSTPKRMFEIQLKFKGDVLPSNGKLHVKYTTPKDVKMEVYAEGEIILK